MASIWRSGANFFRKRAASEGAPPEPECSTKRSKNETETELPKPKRKFALKLMQQSIDNFTVALQSDIEHLTQHKTNVEKYTRYGDHRLLIREHIDASRTVRQLKSNLLQLDRTRLQVQDSDLREFDRKTNRLREAASQILSEFMELSSYEHSHLQYSQTGDETPEEPDHDFEELPSHSEVVQMQLSADLEHRYDAMLEAEKTWRRLHNDLLDLNDLMVELAKVVHEQQEQLDSIEDNIDYSEANVEEGKNQLSKALRYKAAMYPLAGGLVGCAVGGPVGFVAGMKMGVAAAVGGGILGVTGGKLLKKFKTDKEENIEMSDRSVPMSVSCPSRLDKI